MMGQEARASTPTENHGLTPPPTALCSFFAPADRVTVTITREERDAINDANAAIYCADYDGDLFADMFAA
jgi:hypothetical protein